MKLNYTEKNVPILPLEIGAFSYNDILREEADRIMEVQLLDQSLWSLLVDVFRCGNADNVGGTWKGEYWGKMMRGASFIYKSLPEGECASALYEVLEETVIDLLSTQDKYGRIASYSVECEFTGWDLWCRKYVMLGLIYFMEISDNTGLCKRALDAVTAHADYIVSKIGPGKDHPYITACTGAWDGLNSSSILEPFVLLYNLTKEQRYLDFSEYIISCGGTAGENIFEKAYEDKTPLSEYAQPKAYEMISCFDGLCEYSKITGNEKWRTAVIRFADRMLREESTVIGCLGTDSECLNHASLMQSDGSFIPEFPFRGKILHIMQETCVTVTWMKFMWQLWRLTGDSRYMDELEISAYNAMSGSLKSHIDETENGGIILPVYSYSPLRNLPRSEIVGGQQPITADSNYGCCVCISSAGFALDSLASAAYSEDKTTYLNLYRNGCFSSRGLTASVCTAYPYGSTINITVNSAEEGEKLSLRIPAWVSEATVTLNGTKAVALPGYFTVTVKENDVITLEFPMDVRYIFPDEASDVITGRNDYFCVRRGPITYAYDFVAENEPAIDTDSITAKVTDNLSRDAEFRSMVEITDGSGTRHVLVDYRSAGQISGHKVSAWIKKQ